MWHRRGFLVDRAIVKLFWPGYAYTEQRSEASIFGKFAFGLIPLIRFCYHCDYIFACRLSIRCEENPPLLKESAGYRWIPLTKGQWSGKIFHAMTLLCRKQRVWWHYYARQRFTMAIGYGIAGPATVQFANSTTASYLLDQTSVKWDKWSQSNWIAMFNNHPAIWFKCQPNAKII